jgi:hypothetical protein
MTARILPFRRRPVDAVRSDESRVQLVVVEEQRPRTRGDCVGDDRPCPWVSCRHHLFIDRISVEGDVVATFDDIVDMPETCSLDVAERGAMTFEDVGTTLGVSRERVRQIEVEALKSMKRRVSRELLYFEHVPEEPLDSDVFDAAFKDAVDAAYQRIVPASERVKKDFNFATRGRKKRK